MMITSDNFCTGVVPSHQLNGEVAIDNQGLPRHYMDQDVSPAAPHYPERERLCGCY